MKIQDAILLEMPPLPDSWDRGVFTSRSSFRSMIAYAKERAEQIGRGSSRVAFIIPYQGRKTVLKVALNRKGIVQNQEESMLLGDGYLSSEGITIPMIDYDEENGDHITWIHTEFAEKISQKQLERFFGGVSMHTITMYLDSIQGRNNMRVSVPDELHDNELFMSLQSIVGDFGLPAGDLSRKANWGMYRGSPVIIDLGYTDVTSRLY